MEHLNDGDFLRYVTEDLDPQEHIRMDSHLSWCEPCAERMRVYNYIREHFDDLWTAWSAEEHGKVYLKRMILEAAAKTSGISTLSRKALREGLKRAESHIGIAFRFLIDNIKKISAVSEIVADSPYSFEMRPAVAGVGTPDIMDIEEKIKAGEEMLKTGSAGDALELLSKVSSGDARLLQARVMEIISGNKLKARLTVDARKRKAGLAYWPENEADRPGFLLLSAKGGAPPLIAEFKRYPPDDCYIAEFGQLPDGAYDIFVL